MEIGPPANSNWHLLHSSACGEPPDGYELGIIWHEHELGDYPTIGITWEGPFDAPWEYIRDAEKALTRFDEAVDWAAIEPQEEADIGDEDEEEPEEEDADSEITGVTQVLSRRFSRLNRILQ